MQNAYENGLQVRKLGRLSWMRRPFVFISEIIGKVNERSMFTGSACDNI